MFLIFCVLLGQAAWADSSPPDQIERFEREIRPILAQNCGECHGGGRSEGGLALVSREALLAGGDRGPAIIPGDPDHSLLIQAVRRGGELEMPPERSLSAVQVRRLERWVREGAVWPSTSAAGARTELWSLQPLRKPPVPAVHDSSWPVSPIDNFILAKLEAKDLRPSKPASKQTLLRRATFDLVGLPPTVQEIHDFLADDSPDAFARVVDRLLASPHYGERWGRYWLDLVRYAESNGFEYDEPKPNAFQYRDYVIDAFNRDLPYDQLLREMLAGDQLAPQRQNSDGSLQMSAQATACLWFQEMLQFVVDRPRAQAEEVENQIDTLGKSVLGLTLACARCHDHKFDPITTKDYYSLAGVFYSCTNVQACIDSPQKSQRIADTLAAIAARRRQIDRILAAVRTSAKTMNARLMAAKQIASYLGATRMVFRQDQPRETAMAVAAAQYRVSEARLRQWVAAIEGAAERRDELFSAWHRLAHCPPSVFRYRRRTVADICQRANRQDAVFRQQFCQVLADFEGADFAGWSTAGPAFGDAPMRCPTAPILGFNGQGFASSYRGTDAATGRLVSPRIKLGQMPALLAFRMAGTRNPGKVCVNVMDHSQLVVLPERYSVTPDGSEVLKEYLLGLSPFAGREVFIEVVDDDPAGHIVVDDFRLYQGDIEPGDTSPLAANSYVIDLLRLPDVTSHDALDARFQQAIVAALTDFQQHLEAATDDQATTSADKSLELLTRRYIEPERRPFLTLALCSTSPLLDENDLERFLDDGQRSEIARLRAEIADLEAALPASAYAVVTKDQDCRDVAIQLRGDPHRTGEVVPRGFVEILRPPGAGPVTSGSGRRELAEWVASPANPLTARVMANRIWQHHFGRGIVASVDDFGTRGEPPTHPELLDYLANAFIESGWSIKAMHRLLMLSNTYQQDSEPTASESRDPDNKLFHRMPIRRLEAECIRDAILQAAGTLDHSLGGPSVPPAAEDNDQQQPDRSKPHAERRAIYIQVRRNRMNNFLETFDFPRPDACVGQRGADVVPEQALALMNDRFVHRQAAAWGAKLAQSPDPSSRITEMYLQVLGREPTADELQTARNFLRDEANRRPTGVAKSASSRGEPWANLAHVLFNLAEFQFVR